MNVTDEVDLLLILNRHGWSTCWFMVGAESFGLNITHVFSDPYEDLMDAVSQLLRGQMSASFCWYDEPGGHQIEIQGLKEKQHFVQVTIGTFSESYGDAIKVTEPVFSFEISLDHLLTLIYFQLKKTAHLLSIGAFAKERNGGFPFSRFKEFEAEVSPRLKLDPSFGAPD